MKSATMIEAVVAKSAEISFDPMKPPPPSLRISSNRGSKRRQQHSARGRGRWTTRCASIRALMILTLLGKREATGEGIESLFGEADRGKENTDGDE